MSIEESKKGGGKKGGKRGVDNTSRRTWDTEEFEKKAKARAAQVPKPLLQAVVAGTVSEGWLDKESFECRMSMMMRKVRWMPKGEGVGVSFLGCMLVIEADYSAGCMLMLPAFCRTGSSASGAYC